MRIPFIGFLFKKKVNVEPLPIEVPRVDITAETATMDNLKSRINLMVTEMDSMKYQFSALNERLQNIERMVKDIWQMAKS